MMTPFELKLLLHIHTCPGSFDEIAPTSKGRSHLLNGFLVAGLIDECKLEVQLDDHGYSTTEKGKKFIKMILDTPLPDQRWVDPREVPVAGSA